MRPYAFRVQATLYVDMVQVDATLLRNLQVIVIEYPATLVIGFQLTYCLNTSQSII